MTNKQRLMAALEGRPHDRVPFCQYSGLCGPNEEAWELLGRDTLGIVAWHGLYSTEAPNCLAKSDEVTEGGRHYLRTTLTTPRGTLWQEKARADRGWATTRHYIQKPEDYEVLIDCMRDSVAVPQPTWPVGAWKHVGQDGIAHPFIGRTPYQRLWIEWVRLDDLTFHLMDCPDLMAEVFASISGLMTREFAASVTVAKELAGTEYALPYIVIPDNITAPTIGPANFDKYCVPAYRELAALLEAAGLTTPVAVHMDGDLRPLWEAIGASPVGVLDSLSPPPDNDTSPADALRNWPNMRLAVNFPSSVHMGTEEEVYSAAMDILQQGGNSGRLWIQISEDVPTGRWRHSYPKIAEAIRDFASR